MPRYNFVSHISALIGIPIYCTYVHLIFFVPNLFPYIWCRHLARSIFHSLISMILPTMRLWLQNLMFQFLAHICWMHQCQLWMQLINCSIFYAEIPICNSRSWSASQSPLYTNEVTDTLGMWRWSTKFSDFTYSAFI